ncbi:hypothetical protein R69658_06734 [Paraburkholderia aspalathi]|jgi:hypothetical protein|uniref:Uncharacterized protein n=2 Tax=Burkholderiaceae TaxID=119060 RepID=A0A1I7EQP8_9BURK|nr:hypothetical protein R69746_03558 [Paraburkholderia aspalathi]CAE6843696.1 hypothetical protein LMG22931_07374 [Paraburkholderia nemoris]CAE6841203.1 hypothetical protein R69658_06734 [Paraburkholderia aspalathi]CAE6852435.1 hypothetical protein R75465_07234 [Paraburkholderia aspalathi]CAE6854417.1 hypothetical protein R20943_07739 [Paraburkholderia aspalathi]
MHAGIAPHAQKRLPFQNDDVCKRVIRTSGKKMEDPAMEDSDELLLPVWRANLVLLTREVGAATRLARMMTFSASYLKLMLSGQREFSEEFVRGIEAVTGLPAGWMNVSHTEQDIPANAREAIDNEQPLARFRGTAHPVRKKTVLRPPEPIFGQTAPAKRVEEETLDAEAHRRQAHFRKVRDLAIQDVRRFERHLSHAPVELASMRSKVEDVIAAADLDDPIQADLAGRLEQIEKHRHLLLRHVERLQALLAQIGGGD